MHATICAVECVDAPQSLWAAPAGTSCRPEALLLLHRVGCCRLGSPPERRSLVSDWEGMGKLNQLTLFLFTIGVVVPLLWVGLIAGMRFRRWYRR